MICLGQRSIGKLKFDASKGIKKNNEIIKLGTIRENRKEQGDLDNIQKIIKSNKIEENLMQ